MDVPRRSVLVGAVLCLAACAPDPTIEEPDGAPSRAQAAAAPKQSESLAKVAALLAGVRELVAKEPEDAWRAAALAQCDDQLARINSVNPFASPDPVFEPQPESAASLDEAIAAVVDACSAAAHREEAPSTRLLLISIAAATRGLAKRDLIPGEGAEPSPVETLSDQQYTALTHVWALIYGLEACLGRTRNDKALREELSTRLASAQSLRDELRRGLTTPSQPPAFELPGPISTSDEIRSVWRTLEVRLLEALVLLAAEQPDDDRWAAQLQRAQAVGGRIPRWPGWN
ncbi:hypothetical protein [uncultured Tessaracoccus sp.]|uniref:hypothetical protein n=1 Tax=uncultured Tessaracoccus sp. TaxID=905023 RepID=UPI0026135F59|nr:hypothetical protein [uncultured Tessaracoccus sp.]